VNAVSGTPSAEKQNDPEPACACDNAELVVNLGGTLKLDYKETSVSTMEDGSLLLQDRITGNYYILKDGNTQGPYQPGDPKVAGFENNGDASGIDQLMVRYKNYISKSGDKYTINFGGKTYGPYGDIQSFAVSRPKDKFAALVVENVVVNQMDGEAMDKAMKNAKSDQERMQLAMQYSQQMQQKIMQGGGPASMTLKLVTNVPGALFDPIKQPGSVPKGNIKYDDIVILAYDKAYNLKGELLITIQPKHTGADKLFISSANNSYAAFDYGSLLFSDGRSMSDLFNPHLVKSGSQVFLAYMYFSPKRNALMQCKIPF
jgi:hypothetical protein